MDIPVTRKVDLYLDVSLPTWTTWINDFLSLSVGPDRQAKLRIGALSAAELMSPTPGTSLVMRFPDEYQAAQIRSAGIRSNLSGGRKYSVIRPVHRNACRRLAPSESSFPS
jgi:hypothetical protein